MGTHPKEGMAVTPERPVMADFQNSLTPIPIGDITPRPVITTREAMLLPPYSGATAPFLPEDR